MSNVAWLRRHRFAEGCTCRSYPCNGTDDCLHLFCVWGMQLLCLQGHGKPPPHIMVQKRPSNPEEREAKQQAQEAAAHVCVQGP